MHDGRILVRGHGSRSQTRTRETERRTTFSFQNGRHKTRYNTETEETVGARARREGEDEGKRVPRVQDAHCSAPGASADRNEVDAPAAVRVCGPVATRRQSPESEWV